MNSSVWTRWVSHSARSWRDIFEIIPRTGIEKTDDEHRHLVEIALEVNHFINNIRYENIDLNFITRGNELLKQLYTYTKMHFKSEESIIFENKLENYELEKYHHAQILSILKESIRNYEMGHISAISNIQEIFWDWVVVHIAEVDYQTFKLQNWTEIFASAKSWDDLSSIVYYNGETPIGQKYKAVLGLVLNFNDTISVFFSSDDTKHKSVTKIEKSIDTINKHAHKLLTIEERFLNDYHIPFSDKKKNYGIFFSMISNCKAAIGKRDKAKCSDYQINMAKWLVFHLNDLHFNLFNSEEWACRVLEHVTDWNDLRWIIRTGNFGNEIVDQKWLLELCLKFDDAVNQEHNDNTGKTRNAIQVFDYLLEKANEHVVQQELMFDYYEASEVTMHRQEHCRLLDKISEYRHYYESGSVMLSQQLKTTLLKDWINHFNSMDKYTFQSDYGMVKG